MNISLFNPDATGELSLRAALEIGPGDIFVAIALIYTLAYLYLLDPLSLPRDHKEQLREMLLAVLTPLIVSFGAVVLFTSIELI